MPNIYINIYTYIFMLFLPFSHHHISICLAYSEHFVRLPSVVVVFILVGFIVVEDKYLRLPSASFYLRTIKVEIPLKHICGWVTFFGRVKNAIKSVDDFGREKNVFRVCYKKYSQCRRDFREMKKLTAIKRFIALI